MNTSCRSLARLVGATILAVVTGWAQPAAPAPAPTPAAPGSPETRAPRERRAVHVVTGAAEEAAAPREKVAFLGVEAEPAPAALSAQFGLARGIGLVVTATVPGSPAAEVLQKNDLLVRFDDQILVDQRQLSVLVRARAAGENVTLTLFRGGQEHSVTVVLGEREVPVAASWPFGSGWAPDMNFNWRGQLGDEGIPQRVREQVERAMESLRRADGPWNRVIERRAGEPRTTVLHLPRSTFVFSDGAGSVELRHEDERRTLVVRDPAGRVTFQGDVSTEETRAALAPEVRERLEKVESLDRLEVRPPPTMEVREVPLPPVPPVPPAPPPSGIGPRARP